jgi:penicillin-binding protein activator
MKNKIILPAIVAASAAFITGCETNAKYVETGGRDSIVSVGKINDQDFINAASASTSELLASGVLDKVKNPPAILAMSRIVNNTSQQVDIDLLTKKIRVALLQSGKAVTTTTFGLGGQAEDPLAKGIQQQQEFLNDSKPARLPDFTLSGKIIENTAKSGNIRQSTYSFQLSLTDQQGLAVWEGEKQITKQGSQSSVGF